MKIKFQNMWRVAKTDLTFLILKMPRGTWVSAWCFLEITCKTRRGKKKKKSEFLLCLMAKHQSIILVLRRRSDCWAPKAVGTFRANFLIVFSPGKISFSLVHNHIIITKQKLILLSSNSKPFVCMYSVIKLVKIYAFGTIKNPSKTLRTQKTLYYSILKNS